jgi:hypothetical protein
MLAAKPLSVNEFKRGSVKLRNKPAVLVHSAVRRR